MALASVPPTNSVSSLPRSKDSNYELVETLLDKNHSEHALLHHKVLHNHLPHLLSSIYFLKGGPGKLKKAYATESTDLEAWSSSNSLKLSSDEEMKQHMGDISYQQAFVEYFDSRYVSFENDWKSLVSTYLLRGPEPLLSGLVGGFGHPLILLADAFELQSSNLAIEALALNAVDYNDMHQMLSIPWDGSKPTAKPEDILRKISSDKCFDGLFSKAGVQNTTTFFANPQARSAFLEYFQMVDLSNIQLLISELADLAVLLECAVHKPAEPAFDFYLNHSLTFVWCLKVLLPEFTELKDTITLVRSVWLLMALSYITELRPVVTPSLVEEVEIAQRMTWEDVFQQFHAADALEGKYEDPHLLRAMRNLMELGKLTSEKERLYMKAAVKLNSEWKGWSGLGTEGVVGLNTK